MQLTKDGRRILWLAHESAPKNFTSVDVTDPKNPKIVSRADLPQSHMRSNSLETVGDIMAIAYQTKDPGLKPAGFELFDISVPESPKRITFVDLSGPTSRGVHQLWFSDGEYIHMSASSPDFEADPPEGRPVLPVLGREEPVEAGRGRPLVAARHAAGRQRRAAGTPHRVRQRLPAAQHQRLSGPAGPLLHGLHRRRADHARHRRQIAPEDGGALGLPSAQPRLHPYRRAVLRRAISWSSATNAPGSTAPIGRS